MSDSIDQARRIRRTEWSPAAVALLVAGLSLATTARAEEAARLLSDIQTPGGDVISFAWSPDEQHVVYVMDREYDGSVELRSAEPASASAAEGGGGVLLATAEAFDFEITADSSTVVFSAEVAGVSSLSSVPIGGGPAVALGQPLPADRSVQRFVLTPDSQTAVYALRWLQPGTNTLEVFAVPVAGGATTLLDFGFAGNLRILDRMWPTADNSRVVYTGDLDEPQIDDLYSAPLDGGARVKLSAPLLDLEEVERVELTPDGSRVVYETRERRLYTVPADGSAAATELSATSFLGAISDDGSRVYYGEGGGGFNFFRQPIAGGTAEQVSTGVFGSGGWVLGKQSENILARTFNGSQLRSVITSTAQSFPLDASLDPDELVGPDLRFSLDESRAVFQTTRDPSGSPDGAFDVYSAAITGGAAVEISDQATGPVSAFDVAAGERAVVLGADRLASAPLSGGGELVLNDPLPAGGELVDFELNPLADRVAYSGRQTSSGAVELFETGVTGGTPEKLSPPLVARVGHVTEMLAGPNGLYAVYRADQDVYEQPELYSVRLDDGTPAKLNPAIGVDASVREDFVLADAGQRVVFTIEDPGGIDLWSAPIAGGGAVRLNTDALPLEQPGFDVPPFAAVPGGQWVVFLSGTTLYRVALTGGTPTALATGNLEIREFAANTSGTHTVFTTVAASEGEAEQILQSVPTLGGTTTLLAGPAACTWRDFRFSADGSWVAARCGSTTFSLAAVVTGQQVSIGPLGVPSEYDFTPDSQRLLFIAGGDLYSRLLEVEGTSTLIFESNSGRPVFGFELRGGRVLFATAESLGAANVDGTALVNLFTVPGGLATLEDFAVTEDGLDALFALDPEADGTLELYAVAAGGGSDAAPLPGATDADFFVLATAPTQVVYAQGGDLLAQGLSAAATAESLLPPAFDAEPLPTPAFSSGLVLFRAQSHAKLVELFSSPLSGLFIDGFESGDTSRWSATVPGS